MRRSELKKLTDLRLKDAHSLLSGRRYAASYYLAGYAVECAIKVCIASQFKANTVPAQKVVNRYYTHNFQELIKAADLVKAADLERDFDRLRKRDAEFEANWNVVKDWKPDRRYELQITKREAEDLYNAITDHNHGVDQWLRRNW